MLGLLKTVSMKLLSVKFTANEPPEIKKNNNNERPFNGPNKFSFSFYKVTTNIDNVK